MNIYFCRGCVILGLLSVCLCGPVVDLQAQPPVDAVDAVSKPRLFQKLGNLENQTIDESSGLAWSRHHPDSFFTCNDSGGAAAVFWVSSAGKLLAQIDLENAKNIDWEAMSAYQTSKKPYLLVADIGDNTLKRNEYQIYVFPEPDFPDPLPDEGMNRLRAETQRIEFTFEDGSRNCESAAVNPETGELWMIEKLYIDRDLNRSPGIYVLDFQTPASGPRIARRIADYPHRNVTGMSFSPNGDRLIVRNYWNAHLVLRLPDQGWKHSIGRQQPVAVPLPIQRQGEAICFSDNEHLIVTSEVIGQPIWQIDLQRYLDSRPEKQP